MDWTDANQNLLEEYMNDYIKKVSEVSLFYSNINYTKLASIVDFNDIDIIKLRIDEIYDDHFIIQDDLSYSRLKARDNNQGTADYFKTLQSLDLQPFEKMPQAQHQPHASINDTTETVTIEPSPKIEMPKLTKKERRQSLDLMYSRPSLGVRKESQLTTDPAISTTNINVIASSKAVPKNSKKNNEAKYNPSAKPGVATTIKRRRTSLVGEKLPIYIRKQLSENRQVQRITPKSSIKHMALNQNKSKIGTKSQDPQERYSPSNSDFSKKQTRLQNLLSNSQSLYAHSNSNEVDSTTNTSVSENRLRYDTEDDDKEYISPDSLAKYYGLQYEGEEETFEEEDEEEEDDEEDNEYMNLESNNDRYFNGNDENDYLFKVK
ncbi:uncharacterized protein KGF55_000465 [Candida pseudojiufengensis]|uniref:uncharacterized protein n=1 Tax=Candida pseudojiufengensis TaxID=497109 RepID=UPI002224ECD6|nr:uncharacterized protein KGF55_000465 [Candida pseudojiufengensis]KAI5966156.1 hypothetical protein KGF55_000465 [Candida pseudojiufengensis]